jgi:hypothetical protein
MRSGDKDRRSVTYFDLGDAPIAKSVEPVRCSDPDVVLSIFQDDLGLTARKAVGKKKLILFGFSVRLLGQRCEGVGRDAIESTTCCKPKCVGAVKTYVVYVL